jgi:enoyl-[acyl-carrier-protein] reductase (NADH)
MRLLSCWNSQYHPSFRLTIRSVRAQSPRGLPLERHIISGENEFFATVRPSSLLKRFASTDEVASLVTFIASPLSSATNGAARRLDGGVVRSII